MLLKFASRMVTETDSKALRRFALGFGWKGMMAVRRFQRRVKHGEYFPAFLFLSLTNDCNLRCRGCWVTPTDPAAELSPELVDRIIEGSKRQGTTTFGILGGEPMLYEGLIEIFERHPDCYFILFTNGTRIDDAFAERMRRAANVSPLVSIEGLEQVSDERRGGAQVFSRTMAGLEACTSHGLVTGVATSVCRSNLDELATPEFVDELVKRGVHYLWFHIFRPTGPDPAPELALSVDQLLQLRRFLVEIRRRAPLLVVDAYWDHLGRAQCPAAVGMGYHVGPGGDIEVCPPIQFAGDRLNGVNLSDQDRDIAEVIRDSRFLHDFRELARETTRGCILLERPDLLEKLVSSEGVHDSSGRDGRAELAAMKPRPSHHLPGREIPEASWVYRLAKKYWFFGFGAYG